MRRVALDNGHICPAIEKLRIIMALRYLSVLLVVVVASSAYPTSPYWMNRNRSPFAIPQSMAMPALPSQFFPNRALSFSGYFTGSGTPYRGQWAASRQNLSPFYFNQDGSVAAMINDGYEDSHGYNVQGSSVSMDGSGLLVPGDGSSSNVGKVDSVPQPSEVSTTTAFPDPEINTIGGASEEPTPTPTKAAPIEPEPSSTTKAAPPRQPISPAASEPAGASAPPPPPPPPQPPKKRHGGRSKEPQPQPQDDDNDNYGAPTINAWFPFMFGGNGGAGAGANPNRAFNNDDDIHLTPTSYGTRPQYGRNGATPGHSPVAIANSFSTGRNAMAHSVATAYGSPPPNFAAQHKQRN